jgi:hypothetical protein
MRKLGELNAYRITDRRVLQDWSGGWAGDDDVGLFIVLSCVDRQMLRICASAGEGWDHVSVSRATRCPNWPEMSQVAQMFFLPDETAMQLHVPAADHVNNHPYCLHWWRPHGVEIPRPPSIMVGKKDEGILTKERAAELQREKLAGKI